MFTGYQRTKNLINFPSFSKRCNWESLDVQDWYVLLKHQPKFAKKCEVINDIPREAWNKLLEKHPELKKIP